MVCCCECYHRCGLREWCCLLSVVVVVGAPFDRGDMLFGDGTALLPMRDREMPYGTFFVYYYPVVVASDRCNILGIRLVFVENESFL